LVEESGSVIYELKEGPYVPGVGVEFASWAPESKNEEECRLYREKLRAQISKMN